MDDDLEGEILIKAYKTYISYMRIFSKFTIASFNKPVNSTLSYIWRLIRLYILKPEVLFIGIIICILLFYLQAAEIWNRGILAKISNTLGFSRTTTPISKLSILTSAAEKQSWELKKAQSSVYAVQGRRPKMEDR